MYTNELLLHLAQEIITVAYCYGITLKDGTTSNFTDCEHDLIIDGTKYHSIPGIHFKKIHRGDGVVTTAVVEGILGDEMNEKDILCGKYNSATVTILLVHYSDISQEAVTLFKGSVSSMVLRNSRFTATLGGLSAVLSHSVSKVFSPLCRAELCDNQCRVNSKKFTFYSSVKKVIDHYTFEDNAISQSNNYYKYGLVTFLNGKNHNVAIRIRHHEEHTLQLVRPTPNPISADDSYALLAGCDKRFATCNRKFNNAKNFRGEPHIPDLNSIYQPA